MNAFHLLPGCRIERSRQVDPATLHLETEGHANKLKLLKCQMYGRAKFDLLRRRLLLTS